MHSLCGTGERTYRHPRRRHRQAGSVFGPAASHIRLMENSLAAQDSTSPHGVASTDGSGAAVRLRSHPPEALFRPDGPQPFGRQYKLATRENQGNLAPVENGGRFLSHVRHLFNPLRIRISRIRVPRILVPRFQVPRFRVWHLICPNHDSELKSDPVTGEPQNA